MSIPSSAKQCRPRLLLNQDREQAVLASIHQIENVLLSRLKEYELSSTSEVHLAEGTVGIALFFAYLHASGLGPARQQAFDCLAPGFEALAAQPMGASLYAGFTGIAWTAQHINTLLGDSPDDIGSDIDLALETYLKQSPWNHDYDLISGLVGLGIYCLERADSPVARQCLELIVERLSELAEPDGGGLRWHTRANLLPPEQREDYPRGYYNLGLAHGVPGIIGLLGRIHAAGISRERSSRLLEGAVRWLLQQRLPQDAGSSFSSNSPPKMQRSGARCQSISRIARNASRIGAWLSNVKPGRRSGPAIA